MNCNHFPTMHVESKMYLLGLLNWSLLAVKTLKWWKKVFFPILTLIILNTYVLYKENCEKIIGFFKENWSIISWATLVVIFNVWYKNRNEHINTIKIYGWTRNRTWDPCNSSLEPTIELSRPISTVIS